MNQPEGQLAAAWAITLVIVGWSYVWTLAALWKAARQGRLGWYVALAIFTFPGLLAMLYLFFVAPRQPEEGVEWSG
jgi:hypothetical protein